jgi:PAS domain S-box-containing protein
MKTDPWEERYRLLVDSLNIGFLHLDREQTILDVNRTMLEMTGWEREELLGHHASKIYGKELYAQLIKISRPLRDHGKYQFEFVLPTTDHQLIPALHNTRSVMDAEGNLTSIFALISDIRSLKQAQAELETTNQALRASQDELKNEVLKLGTILLGIDDCVTIFDADGKILLSNPQGMEIRGGRKSPFCSLQQTNQMIDLEVGGEVQQFHAQLQEIRNSNGEVFALVETLHDITPHIRLQEQAEELNRVKRKLKRFTIKSRMVGQSKALESLFEMVVRCAEVESPVLLLGETGVGKEMAARAIHQNSSRSQNPFVAINCGALSSTLLESELFGHVKGAFTGATHSRKGLFREASGGTLFLDEIGDMEGALQVKLLRTLQEMEVRPLGGSETHKVDVRILCATNKNLEEMVEQGSFRRDLYYRIAVIPLHIPPLRERREDILPLAEHFAKALGKKGSGQISIDPRAQQALLDWSWPGNIRELQNAIEYTLALSEGNTITCESLPFQIANAYCGAHDQSTQSLVQSIPQALGDSPAEGRSRRLKDQEKEAIARALERHGGNRSLAAKDLGIARSTLWRKIKE